MRFFVICLIVLAVAPPAYAQESLEQRFNQIEKYFADGDYVNAAPLATRALQISEERHGRDSRQAGIALNQIGVISASLGHYREAEQFFSRSVKIFEMTMRGKPPLATALANLGRMQQHLSRLSLAEESFNRAVAIFEQQPREPPDLGFGLKSLAALYRVQGKLLDAERLYLRAIASFKRVGDEGLPQAALASCELARLYWEQGRSNEAEPMLIEAVTVLADEQGSHHPMVALALAATGSFYTHQGRFAEAEKHYLRGLEIARESKNAVEVAIALNNLGTAYQAQDRLDDAERMYQEGMVLIERAVGGSEDVAIVPLLDNFSKLLLRRGRFSEALSLYRRQLLIVATAGDQATYADALTAFANLLVQTSEMDKAEEIYRQVLAIRSKSAPETSSVAETLGNLGFVLRKQGRHSEAVSHIQRAMQIWGKTQTPDFPLLARAQTELATSYVEQGRLDEAAPIYERALRSQEKILGRDHSQVGRTLYALADLHIRQSRWAEATRLLRRATDIVVRQDMRGAQSGETTTRPSGPSLYHPEFGALLSAAFKLQSEGNGGDQLAREMFETAQHMQTSIAARTIMQMAVRSASGRPMVGELVRERQALVAEWQHRDALRNAAFARAPGERDSKADGLNFERLGAIDAHIADIDRRLTTEFPTYATLARSAPLSVSDVQAQLRPDEALVQFVEGLEDVFVWVVTTTNVRWVHLEIKPVALKREVLALRCGLDASVWYVEASEATCRNLIKGAPKRGTGGEVIYETLPFDTARARSLYKALLGPLKDDVDNKKHLLVVLSGSLTQLPLSVLVSDNATSADPRSVRWLVRDHAVTVLPSASSLKALRLVAKPSAATRSMVGFGNPLLHGDPSNPWHVKWLAQARDAKACKGLLNSRTANAFQMRQNVRQIPMRSGYASLAELKSQVPLPDTAVELCTVANALKSMQEDIFLGARATETNVKRLSSEGQLANYRVVHFATHGALAGEVKDASEPGLILTPPDKQTQLDDGYLSASEVSALKLDADWVILSACNTAAGEEITAEALSGLARAFFFAGARAVLASHWGVASPTTVKLITSTFANLAKNPQAGRSEVLRQAMLTMIDNGEAHESHPAFWAPFVVVGEGSVTRQ